jgi:predicted DNA-binding antitoxin AbrB/MazE fold protein
MVKSVEGIYRNGKVELLQPLEDAEGSRVIVTLVRPAEPVDLRERGIDESQAADLRHRLERFGEASSGVVQADRLGTGLPQTVVAMITINTARAGTPQRSGGVGR